MQSKQYFTKIKNYPHEKSTEPCLSQAQFENLGELVKMAIFDA